MTRPLRSPVAPPLAEEALSRAPLHRVVRDYPETLALLRERGVDPGTAGGETVEALGGRWPGLDREILERIAWRSPPSGDGGTPWDG